MSLASICFGCIFGCMFLAVFIGTYIGYKKEVREREEAERNFYSIFVDDKNPKSKD